MSQWGELWAQFKGHKTGMIGLAIILTILLLAISVSILPLYDPIAEVGTPFAPISMDHPFGTDDLGRDVLTRVIWGSRISMRIALSAVALSLLLGGTFGLISGYSGGIVDGVIMRAMDILFAFPSILLALVIIVVVGRAETNLILALGIVYTPILARVTRGVTLKISEETFVEAAKAIGSSSLRILLKEILPNALPTIIVQSTLVISYAILDETALTFIGMGTQPPTPSWGLMLSDGRVFLVIAPLIAILPGLICTITVLGFNLLGDGLRDCLDPRLRW